ncbi:MAG: ATP-binding protein [Bacteroidetes bacterium]|nr:ATP-binding protein [Bacteroidota bacterium]MCY4204330.1 ATP-binding protein [Bacteroidota bacterium]
MTEHPYLDTSHISNIAPDRGPSKYFHGRTQILRDFNDFLRLAMEEKTGTIFLIQGAPGAGKTALLYECKKFAEKREWEIAEIDPPALWNLDELLYYLGKEDKVQFTGGSGEIGINAGVKAGVKLNVETNQTRPTILKTLQDGKKPLLLILDEAQSLGIKDIVPSDQKRIINSVLNNIHNGRLRRSVILLAAGLEPSKSAFDDLGISRFRAGCFVELGALGKKAERAVIHDWLMKKGCAKGDPIEWIDAIVQKTHGWPQHITVYGDAAAKQIQKDQGVMTPEGLEIVYQTGRERRKAYYKQRVVGIEGNELICLYEAIAGIEPGTPFGQDLILAPLDKKYGYERAEEIFKKFIGKGLLSPVDTLYSVPIPSMHDWMKSELKRTHERLRQAKVVQNADAHCKSIDPDPEDRNTLKQPTQSKESDIPPKDRGSKFDMER